MTGFKFEAWPTEFHVLPQYFGVNPQNYGQFGLPGHDGLDIRAPKGSKVYAVAPGRVKLVVRDPGEHNYGIHIRITRADGYETIYAHLEEVLVKEGNRVQTGTLIGLAGDTGNSFGSHLHLTLKRKGTTLRNWPGNIIDPTPFLLPLLAWKTPAEPDPNNLAPPDGVILGWVWAEYLQITGHFAMVGRHGANMRGAPKLDAEQIGQVQWGFMVTLVGLTVNGYAPVFIYNADVVNWRQAKKSIQKPKAFPISEQGTEEETITGWALTAQINVTGTTAVVGRTGVNLRKLPRRNGELLGYVPLGTRMKETDPPAGEYTPVRITEHEVQQLTPEQTPPLPDPDPKPLGQVRIGLHAAADPDNSTD